MVIDDNRYQEAKKEFWERIDELNPFATLTLLTKKAGIEYWHLVQQRKKKSIPKAEDLLKLSATLHVPIERLLTGKAIVYIPERIQRIVNRLMCTASEEQVFAVEVLLGLQSEYTLSKKAEIKKKCQLLAYLMAQSHTKEIVIMGINDNRYQEAKGILGTNR